VSSHQRFSPFGLTADEGVRAPSIAASFASIELVHECFASLMRGSGDSRAFSIRNAT
jgi:hypothetical protein